MKIFKAKDEVMIYSIVQFILRHNLGVGSQFGISWKVKKNRKLRRYRIINWHYLPLKGDDADYSHETQILELAQGNNRIKLDSMFGPFYFKFPLTSN